MDIRTLTQTAGKGSRTLLAIAATTALAIAIPATSARAGQCMADASGISGLNCTANDFAISSITVTNIVGAGCQNFGDTLTFDGLVGVGSGSTNRYDVGFYISTDGTQAYTGTCNVSIIPLGSGYADLDHDQCGDYNGNAITVPVHNVTTKCVDNDNNGFFDMVVCTSWDNNTMPACNGPADAYPATKSKCECQVVNTTMRTPHCSSNADCSTDNNVCTDEVCNAVGSGLGDSFGCSHNPNTATCDDGQFCTTGDHCSAGSCVGTARNCSDNNVCTTDSCDEANDRCVNTNNTNSCDDGLFCTTGDTCSGGVCAGTPRSCNDNNVCTDDSCNEDTNACVNTPNASSCDDGQFCTTGDHCSAGSCVGTAVNCDDSNPCTNDSCSNAQAKCLHANNTAACDDGLFCTTGDACSGGSCSGSPRSCNDNNDCTDDSCSEQSASCVNTPNSNACDDGLFCTTGDTCSAGSCGGQPKNCSDNNDCTDDSCDEAGKKCVNTNNTAPCDDGKFCTEGDTCSGGACSGTPKTCNDNNDCTDDSCDEAGSQCVNAPNTNPCDDGIFCDGTDTCANGACGHSGNPCPGPDGDGNCAESCNEDAQNCSANDADGSPCDDGLFCTENDSCQSGVCFGTAKTCDDHNICTDDSCDDEADQCVNTPVADDTPCDDNNDCTIDDKCVSAQCQGHQTVLLDLCPWIAVERQDPKHDALKVNTRATVDGSLCGGYTKVGNTTVVDGNIASNLTSGTRAIRLTPDMEFAGDCLSGGGGVKARPRDAHLPDLDIQVSSLAPGSLTSKSQPPGGVYDLTGSHPFEPICDHARNQYPDIMAVLDGLGSSASFPKTTIKSFGSLTITAPNPGSVNVIDYVQIRGGRNVSLMIDGGGDPNTVVVLRVQKKFTLKLLSVVALQGDLQAQNLLIYAKGKKCVLGDHMNGSGTVFCAQGRLKFGKQVSWLGTFYGAGHLFKIGDSNNLDYQPFLGF
ncbi:MAG TPA: hypothetical protein VGK20_07130 [Candidatus Binatia bacterium]